jgi:amino acid transporter
VITAFLAAIYSGAYAVVTSISTIGLYLSYIIPVYLSWRARGTQRQLKCGPWRLGRFSPAINFIAMLWVIFLSVILSLPDNLRAGKSIVVVTIALALWYMLHERHRFTGPAWSAGQTERTEPPG